MDVVETVAVADGVTYEIHDKHRDGTPHAGQWYITQVEEIASFRQALDELWLQQTVGFGIHVVNGRAEILGRGYHGGRYSDTLIARFNDDGDMNVWHGFPVANSHNDNRPHYSIIHAWMNSGYIRKRIGRLLIGGAQCHA
jgi:hypothetical protein